MRLVSGDDDRRGPSGGSGPKSPQGGAISGFSPAAETSGSPGAGHVMRQGIDEYDSAIVSGAGIYNGVFPLLTPAVAAPLLASPAFVLP